MKIEIFNNSRWKKTAGENREKAVKGHWEVGWNLE